MATWMWDVTRRSPSAVAAPQASAGSVLRSSPRPARRRDWMQPRGPSRGSDAIRSFSNALADSSRWLGAGRKRCLELAFDHRSGRVPCLAVERLLDPIRGELWVPGLLARVGRSGPE
jgi:hypothetical protein